MKHTKQIETGLYMRMLEVVSSTIWRSGGTAPKDGTLFLGFYNGAYIIMCYDEEDDFGWAGDGIPPSEAPDYWLPLPPPPISKGNQA